MKEHLTSKEVTAWQSGVSDADEILRIDDHLAICPECRALVASAAECFGLLESEFSSPHLTEAQLDDYAQHRPLSADLMQHLDTCQVCHSDAADLRVYASSVVTAPAARPPHRTWLVPMAAAFAITALGLAAWLTLQQNSIPTTAPAPTQLAAAAPTPYDSEIQAAISSGNLQIPAPVAALASGTVQLRSLDNATPKAAILTLLAPLSTAVIEDTPTFRWNPVAGATYNIAVYDDRFRQVASASTLTTTEWQPAKPLSRGAIYRWEVQAVTGKHVDRAPLATQPEARFLVLAAPDAQKLSDAKTKIAGNPLALGILYANAGALDDARRELTAAASNPAQSSLAARLLAQLNPAAKSQPQVQ